MYLKRVVYAFFTALTLLALPSWGYTNEEAWRLYLDVCQFGSKAEMERFFNLYDIDVNTKDPESGKTGLELAAGSNFHSDAVQYLVSREPSRETLNNALKVAVYNNTVEIARILETALDQKGGPLEDVGGRIAGIADKLERGKTPTFGDLYDVLKNGSLSAIREMLIQGAPAKAPSENDNNVLELFFARRDAEFNMPEGWSDLKELKGNSNELAEVLELLLWRGASPEGWLSFWVGSMYGGSASFSVTELSLPNLRMFEALLKAGSTEKLSRKTVTYGPEWPDAEEKPQAYSNAATLWKKYQYYSKLTKAQRQTVREKFFKEMEDRYQNVQAKSLPDLLKKVESDGVSIAEIVSVGTGQQLHEQLSRLDLSKLISEQPEGAVPLVYRAARCNNDPTVIDALMRVKKANYSSYENSYKFSEFNPLLPAAQWNSNPDVIRALLLYGLDLGRTDKLGLTPLRLAAKYNPNPKVVETLYERRPENLLMIAGLVKDNSFMSEENRDALTLKLVQMKYKDLTESSFVDLCGSGPADDVELILRSKLFDPNLTAADGRTPLTFAAERGRADIVAVLLSAGADTDKANANGIIPLMAAALSGDGAIVSELVQGNANVNATGQNGITPLMFTVAYCMEPGMTYQLLNAGANLEATDANGWTPLCYAVANGSAKMIMSLLTVGADVNVKPNGQNIVSLFQRNKYLSDEAKYSLSKDIRMLQR